MTNSFEKIASTETKGETGDRLPGELSYWSSSLKNNDQIPFGISLLDRTTKKYLTLDFDTLIDASKIENYTSSGMDDIYTKNKALFEIGKLKNENIDPYLLHACYQIQNKVYELLELDNKDEGLDNREKYLKMEKPLISKSKKTAKCTEKAALGQYLF
ncbi:MAG: hypothetical protein GF335_03695 [Candidatus Moranbacteria bacterium]|nr:hypothetical protein [Candidatus Moranbacteria bacterium]